MAIFYLELVQNVGLLVSLVVIHGQILRRWNKRTLTSQVFSGFLFGCVALVGMMTPVHLMPGVIFDGRSIVLSVAGFFGGPVIAGMAAIMSVAYRLWLGGPGVIMGVSSIVESAGLGVAFYYLRPLYPGLTRNLYLFGFGLLVHVGVLLLTLALPKEAMLKSLEHMAVPVLLIFPAATWLICLLFLDQESRIAAEEALRETEERHRSLIEHLPQRIFIKNSDLVYLSCNENYASDRGVTPEQIVGKDDFSFHTPELAEAYRANDQACMATGVTTDIEETYQLDGQVRWAHTTKVPYRDRQGQIIGVLGIYEDITERKRSEEALAEAVKRYRLIAETIHDCFWMATPDIDKMLYVSPAYETIWGRSCESLYESPRSFVDAIHPDDRDRVMDVMDKARSQLTSWNSIYQIVRPDGSIRWIEDRGFPVLNDKGKCYLNIGVATDITDRKKTEEQLRQSEEKYQKLFQDAPLMYVITRNERGIPFISDCNKLFLRAMGFTRQNVIGKPLAEFYSL